MESVERCKIVNIRAKSVLNKRLVLTVQEKQTFAPFAPFASPAVRKRSEGWLKSLLTSL